MPIYYDPFGEPLEIDYVNNMTESLKILNEISFINPVGKSTFYIDTDGVEATLSTVFLGFSIEVVPHENPPIFESAFIVKENITVLTKHSSWKQAYDFHVNYLKVLEEAVSAFQLISQVLNEFPPDFQKTKIDIDT